jgi:hypothetical protein
MGGEEYPAKEILHFSRLAKKSKPVRASAPVIAFPVSPYSITSFFVLFTKKIRRRGGAVVIFYAPNAVTTKKQPQRQDPSHFFTLYCRM